jgi:hypothetical protein
MFRIDNSSVVPALPIAPPPGTPGFFTNGDPQTALPATRVDDWWCNMLQEEILTVITKAGLVPDKNDNTQLWQALRLLNPRQVLTTVQTNFYVANNGSDTNDGLAAATPWQTLQHASNFVVNQVDFAGQQVTINIAPGNYAPFTQNANPTGCFGADSLIYNGNISSPSTVVISSPTISTPAITMNGAQATIQGVTLQTSGDSLSHCILAGPGCLLMVKNVIFGPCTGDHMGAVSGSIIYLMGSYTINGGAQTHMFAVNGGSIATFGEPVGVSPFSVTVSGTPAFSVAFADASSNGSIGISPAVLTAFSGAATGQRYLARACGTINVNGGGQNFFPGSTAGVADATTYGVYLP